MNPTDPKVRKLKEEFTDMEQLSKEQKLAALRKLVDSSKAAAAKVDSSKPLPVVLKFGSDLKPLEFVPSSLLELDELCGQYQDTGEKDDATGAPIYVWTGRGGPVVKGRYVIWWGGFGCGKTTMALLETGQAQAQGLVCGYFNSERALDPVWAAKRGVDLDELLVWEGGNLEQNLDSMIHVMEQGLIDFIVIDTIHAFAAKADLIDGKKKARGMQDEPPQGRLAAKLSRFFRCATGKVAESQCAVLLIGQARQNEDWEQLTGGHALKHYVSLNLHFTRINSKKHTLLPVRKVKRGDDVVKVPVGFVMKIQVDKTRLNHRDQQFIEVPFLWGLGPDNFEMNVLAAVKLGIGITKAGNYYTINTGDGPIKVNGKGQLMEWMRAQPVYYDWLMANITGNYSEPEELAAEAEAEEDPKPKKKTKKKRGK
jgi:RecA/RadA recombinase